MSDANQTSPASGLPSRGSICRPAGTTNAAAGDAGRGGARPRRPRPRRPARRARGRGWRPSGAPFSHGRTYPSVPEIPMARILLLLALATPLALEGAPTPRPLPPTRATPVAREAAPSRRLLWRAALEDKVRGGWAGQMIGVSFGAPTEFRSNAKILEGPLPKWRPNRVENAIDQDDLYVEMTFAAVMDHQGLDATSEQYGEAF